MKLRRTLNFHKFNNTRFKNSIDHDLSTIKLKWITIGHKKVNGFDKKNNKKNVNFITKHTQKNN